MLQDVGNVSNALEVIVNNINDTSTKCDWPAPHHQQSPYYFPSDANITDLPFGEKKINKRWNKMNVFYTLNQLCKDTITLLNL